MVTEFSTRWERTAELYGRSRAAHKWTPILNLCRLMLEWGGRLNDHTAIPPRAVLIEALSHRSWEVVDAGVEALMDTAPAHTHRLAYLTDIRGALRALGRSRIAWYIDGFRTILPHDELLELTRLGLRDTSVLVRREAAYTCHAIGIPELVDDLERIAASDPDDRVRTTAAEAASFILKGYHCAPEEDGHIPIVRSGPSNQWSRQHYWIPSTVVQALGIERVVKELEREDSSHIPPSWERPDWR